MTSPRGSWEEAVAWARAQPDQHELVIGCYYDDPLVEAARRFAASEEWAATRQYLPSAPGEALDLGAGRGISSFALASDGWTVSAVEPDASDLVGAGALRQLAAESQLPIRVSQVAGEELPFPDASFDLVYAREVLHHARSLDAICREAWRVLRPGGIFVAAREHVVKDRGRDLESFLSRHPLHWFYGGENAYTLRQYLDFIRGAGFRRVKTIAPYDNAVNSSMTATKVRDRVIAKVVGRRLAKALWSVPVVESVVFGLAKTAANALVRYPGRPYSFVAVKD